MPGNQMVSVYREMNEIQVSFEVLNNVLDDLRQLDLLDATVELHEDILPAFTASQFAEIRESLRYKRCTIELGLKVLDRMEENNQQIHGRVTDAEVHSANQVSEAFEPSWYDMVPADGEPETSNSHVYEDLPRPVDVPSMPTFTGRCPENCILPQSHCTVLEQLRDGKPYSPASGAFFEPTSSQQAWAATTRPPSPHELAPPFIFEDPTDTQQVPNVLFDEHVSEICQQASTSGDPFFQHFQHLAAELGPSAPSRSRFFPTTSVDQPFAVPHSFQSACEYSECSDEPFGSTVSDDENEVMNRQKEELGDDEAGARQLPTTIALFPQHIPGGIFDSLRSEGELGS